MREQSSGWVPGASLLVSVIISEGLLNNTNANHHSIGCRGSSCDIIWCGVFLGGKQPEILFFHSWQQSESHFIHITWIFNFFFSNFYFSFFRQVSYRCLNYWCERRGIQGTAKASTSSARVKRTLKCTNLFAGQLMTANLGYGCWRKLSPTALKKVSPVFSGGLFNIHDSPASFPAEGITSENEEEKKLLEARSVRIRQLISMHLNFFKLRFLNCIFFIDQMHQRDQEVQNMCDEKMKLIVELLEVFAKDELHVVGWLLLFSATNCFSFPLRKINRFFVAVKDHLQRWGWSRNDGCRGHPAGHLQWG